MRSKKIKAKSSDAARARLIKQISEPRMARSARIAEKALDHARIPERRTVTMPGTVDKIIPPPRPRKQEKAQIAVDGARRPHRDLRIANVLLDENGDDVKLKKGARVEVTVTSQPKACDTAGGWREALGMGFSLESDRSWCGSNLQNSSTRSIFRRAGRQPARRGFGPRIFALHAILILRILSSVFHVFIRRNDV
jgi:hypothetical protein